MIILLAILFMAFIVCGLNHSTAPLLLREKIAFSPAMQEKALLGLLDLNFVSEAVILSTCNRTEIYAETKNPACIAPWLVREKQLTEALLTKHLYLYHEKHAISHALRVASGLDSMMLGEPQIFGQIKQAYHYACTIGAVNDNLHQIFQYIFNASKRIRRNSGISKNPTSLAFAAAKLIAQHFVDYKSLRVLIIGSGEMAALIVKYLHSQGVRDFSIASRIQEHANQLSTAFGGKTVAITEIPQHLSKADVVISATTCPLPFITKDWVVQALSQRNNSPMFLLDLALPRDIEPVVGELEAVKLYNIDDLQAITDKGMEQRRLAAIKAEQLIESELGQFIKRYQGLQAKQVICNYRNQMQHVADKELKRALAQLSAGNSQDKVLAEFCGRLVNKLTHHPTTGIRRAAIDGRSELVDLAHYLFDPSIIKASYEEIS